MGCDGLGRAVVASLLGCFALSGCSTSHGDLSPNVGSGGKNAAGGGGADARGGSSTDAGGTGASPSAGGSSGTGASPSAGGSSGGGSSAGMNGGSPSMTGGSPGDGGSSGRGGSSGGASRGGAGGSAGSQTASGGASGTGSTSGWLYTQGNRIYVSDGSGGGQPWMGRGVNVDDLFLCGYNGSLWMTDAETQLTTLTDGLITGWKPNFVRISLALTGFTTVSWFSDTGTYATPMTNVIHAMGAHAGVYVLVTLRTDASMNGSTSDNATYVPADSSNTPDPKAFPRGTDPLYEALVDTFAHDAFVLFGVSNEPGGNTLTSAELVSAMDHAVKTIRAEEDKLGVPHHLVAVQGNGWTSDISMFGKTPLTEDNVVYEVHGYPPSTSSYTYSNIPVILGEYGTLDASSQAAFFADVESKQIPNLAWDFDSFSDCAPDLLNVNQSSTNLQPSAWGDIVKAYLGAHAP